MKHTRNLKRATRLMGVVLVFHIIYNTYFGWNETPINSAEEICDGIGNITFTAAVILYCLPILSLYERSVWKMDRDKKWSQFNCNEKPKTKNVN